MVFDRFGSFWPRLAAHISSRISSLRKNDGGSLATRKNPMLRVQLHDKKVLTRILVSDNLNHAMRTQPENMGADSGVLDLAVPGMWAGGWIHRRDL